MQFLETGSAQIDISALLKKYNVPGASLAFIDAATLVWSGAFGVKNKMTEELIDAQTIFEAGSLSKPLFAYIVLNFFAQYKLSLDTPLQQFLPGTYTAWNFRANEENLKWVTARHILSHSAGFSNWNQTTGSMAGRLQFIPGEKFAYSGEGYIYLQRVLERLSGQSLAALAAAYLATLNMSDSSYIWKLKYQQNFAAGHGMRNEGLTEHFNEAFSAFSLYTTAADFAKFMLEMMAPDRCSALKSEKTIVEEMLNPQIHLNSFCSWGLGWGIEHCGDDNYFWQWGDMGDTQCFALGSRNKQQGMVILTNSENGLRLSEEIMQRVFSVQHLCADTTFLGNF